MMQTTTKPTIPLAVIGAKHPEVLAWIITNERKSDFAKSLHDKVKRFKVLTEGQLAAVQKIIAGTTTTTAVAAASEVNASAMAAVQAAFDSAIGSGIKRPKLRLAEFILSPAKAGTANAGAIYVVDAIKQDDDGQRLYLGKILASQFVPVKACTVERQGQIAEACADPLKEAIAYGRRTGVCACCGRTLTDPESIDRGIGPICAGRWFGA